MIDKNQITTEIREILKNATSSFESKKRASIGEISRLISFEINIFIDFPSNVDHDEFREEVIVPIMAELREKNWHVTHTVGHNGVGFYISLC